MPSKSTPNSDPVLSAREAGLRYVADTGPGIRREMGPLGFKYIEPSGRVPTDLGPTAPNLVQQVSRAAVWTPR